LCRTSRSSSSISQTNVSRINIKARPFCISLEIPKQINHLGGDRADLFEGIMNSESVVGLLLELDEFFAAMGVEMVLLVALASVDPNMSLWQAINSYMIVSHESQIQTLAPSDQATNWNWKMVKPLLALIPTCYKLKYQVHNGVM
jgi:hypothetical protein